MLTPVIWSGDTVWPPRPGRQKNFVPFSEKFHVHLDGTKEIQAAHPRDYADCTYWNWNGQRLASKISIKLITF